MKKGVILKWGSILIVIIVLSSFGFGWYSRSTSNLEARLLYIRSVEREGFSYYATTEAVEESIGDIRDFDDFNIRSFDSLERLPLSIFTITDLIDGGPLSVWGLKSLLEKQPIYTNVIFEVGVSDLGKILKIEEKLID